MTIEAFEDRFTAAVEAAAQELADRQQRFDDEYEAALGSTLQVFAKAAEILMGFSGSGSITVSASEPEDGFRAATVTVEMKTASEDTYTVLLAFVLDSDEPIRVRGLDATGIEFLIGEEGLEELGLSGEGDGGIAEEQVIFLDDELSANMVPAMEDLLIRIYRDL